MIEFLKNHYKEVLSILNSSLDFILIILMIWWIKLLNKIWKGEKHD